jgi:hypothetical protein
MDGHIPLSGAGVWNGEIIAPAQFYMHMYTISLAVTTDYSVTSPDAGVLLIHG